MVVPLLQGRVLLDLLLDPLLQFHGGHLQEFHQLDLLRGELLLELLEKALFEHCRAKIRGGVAMPWKWVDVV
jgi:hypothetical protein